MARPGRDSQFIAQQRVSIFGRCQLLERRLGRLRLRVGAAVANFQRLVLRAIMEFPAQIEDVDVVYS